MLVAIDKSRCNHQPFGIDGFLACNLVFSDDGDLAVLNADVGDGVLLGFRVHDPASVDDQVIIGSNCRHDHHQAEYQQAAKHSQLFQFVPPFRLEKI